MKRLGENTVLNLKNKSHTITAEVEVPETGAEGVIVAAGWRNRRLERVRGRQQAQVLLQHAGHRELHGGRAHAAAGGARIRWRRRSPTTAAASARAGRSRCWSTSSRSAKGGSSRPLPFQYSFDETLDVGLEVGSTVSAEYKVLDNAFTGKIKWVRLDIGSDSHDHLIDPEHRIQVAMLKQ